jgi:hypothetical protein
MMEMEVKEAQRKESQGNAKRARDRRVGVTWGTAWRGRCRVRFRCSAPKSSTARKLARAASRAFQISNFALKLPEQISKQHRVLAVRNRFLAPATSSLLCLQITLVHLYFAHGSLNSIHATQLKALNPSAAQHHEMVCASNVTIP